MRLIYKQPHKDREISFIFFTAISVITEIVVSCIEPGIIFLYNMKNHKRGVLHIMQSIRDEIIKAIEEMNDEKTLKVIYQFIRGLKSGRK